jgi:hypothetical protein
MVSFEKKQPPSIVGAGVFREASKQVKEKTRLPKKLAM